MYIYRNIKWNIVFRFAWKNLIFFTIYGSGVLYLHHWFSHQEIDISIPFAPLSTIAIAVSFYIGFKNNQSYDRFWEARKIWGGIVNYSRTWGNQVVNLVDTEKLSIEDAANLKRVLIYRQLAWINALRLQLRRPSSFSIKFKQKHMGSLYKGAPEGEDWRRDVGPFLTQDEINDVKTRKNVATNLIKNQGAALKQLQKKNQLNPYEHIHMMETLEELYNLQGKCERIKNTPLPRQYAYFSTIFIWIFILLLPLGLVGEFAAMGHNYIWITVPSYVLISWIFNTMEKVGDSSEDPFENFINDVPMSALCRTIEIDLRDMLDEKDLPEKVLPVKGVLM